MVFLTEMWLNTLMSAPCLTQHLSGVLSWKIANGTDEIIILARSKLHLLSIRVCKDCIASNARHMNTFSPIGYYSLLRLLTGLAKAALID